ncbi:MAG: adenylosuccinate lyase [Xanthomonadales bacterium]|nr:adenylosuccinate lyase [Xanthomonadales bacterium]|tara:strand:- start:3238 stop:3978 length:741 start_codon:yes stop_codon:yes gene_type:complete
MRPGFSERTFEFCFNAEFCHLNSALLASHPHIPTQNAEKDLGYDVEFELKKKGATKSIFLQHKVSSYAFKRAGRNAKFYDHHGGEYYRFAVDNDQHFTLHDLALNKGDAYYCAPCFRSSKDLETHWRANAIGENAILLDPRQVGLVGPGRHNITYGPSGENPAIHSETKRFERSYRGDKNHLPPLTERSLTEGYFEELSSGLMARASKRRDARSIIDKIKTHRPIEIAQILLGRVYKVSWLLLADD